MLLLLIYIIINTYYIKIAHHKIYAKVNDNISFVHISDLHGYIRFINGRISKVINNLHPDFVVVTGDLSNNSKQLGKVLSELSKINTKNGVIIVPGNYEREELHLFKKRNRNIDEVVKLISETPNITFLQNSPCIIKKGTSRILVFGFDNSMYGIEEYPIELNNIENNYKIVLAHSPNIIKVIENIDMDFNQILVGHTHGGQINLLGNLHLGKYKAFHIGIRKYKNGLFCISRGLGTVKIPFRINCFPELSIYHLTPRK